MATKTNKLKQIRLIPTNLIDPNPQQPRREFDQAALQELADSIQEHGIIQPIEVEEGVGGRYILHHGERRLRASKLAGLHEIPAVIADALDDKTRLARALVENIQREDMNPIEMAQAFAEMRRFGMPVIEISRRTGKTQSTVKNHLEWLKLDQPIQEMVARGELPRDVRVREALESIPESIRIKFAMRCKGMTIKGVQKASSVLLTSLDAQSSDRRPTNNTHAYDCRDHKKGTGGRRAHCLTLVVNDCPIPGPQSDIIERVAQATCEGCNLFEYKASISCKECPATAMVRGLVRAAERQMEAA